MPNYNSVQLVGNVGRDPEVTTMENGTSRLTFPLATHERWESSAGRREHTDWHDVVVFGRKVEYCRDIRRGAVVFVAGRLRAERWVDPNGGSSRTVFVLADLILQLSPTYPTSRL